MGSNVSNRRPQTNCGAQNAVDEEGKRMKNKALRLSTKHSRSASIIAQVSLLYFRKAQ